VKNSTAHNSATETLKQFCKRLSLEKQKPALPAPCGMAGNYFHRCGTHTPLKNLPSATLQSGHLTAETNKDLIPLKLLDSFPLHRRRRLRSKQTNELITKWERHRLLPCHASGSGHHLPKWVHLLSPPLVFLKSRKCNHFL